MEQQDGCLYIMQLSARVQCDYANSANSAREQIYPVLSKLYRKTVDEEEKALITVHINPTIGRVIIQQM